MSSQYPVDTYYDKCVYKECKNGKFSHGKRLFRFPMQKNARYNTWIRNTGNTNLEKLSANTLRKCGLCEDHFLATSFTNVTKERLTRNAIPIAYENVGSSAKAPNVQSGIIDVTEQRDITAALSSNNGNVTMEGQMSKECVPRTYRSATLNFEISAEEEGIMEWIRFEPSKHQDVERNSSEKNVKCKDHSIEKTKKQKCNPKSKIKALRNEIFNLRQKIKCLKSRMQRMAQTCKCKDSNKEKQKKEVLKNLINEQDLHPIAKSMIHLQLHIPHTRYTKEEKMLSKQLYYYSASAFCRLRKAGFNFPKQRTIRRWIEEYED